MAKIETCYIWNENLIEHCNRLPAVTGRAVMVHDLIQKYELVNKLKVVRSSPATYKDMREFHSELYLDHLKGFLEVDDDYMTNTLDEECGIGYDCPPVSNMFELVSCIAGGTLTAARCLMLGLSEVAINWCGGWHHAHRFGAEGFCYINDVVLAIEQLKKKFPKILYIDLDVHHGNGVQDAYNISKSVFTLSIHKYEPGFYPGTGGVDDIGAFGGKGYACNVPLHAGYSDNTLECAFERVFQLVFNHFSPDAIVVQCGADALAHDPNGGATLTARSYCKCVRTVLDKRKPTMLLGGGGYNHANTARLWTSITAMVVGVELDEQIPEHSHWPKYGPTYTIDIEPTLAKDNNKSSYIEDIVNKIRGNLEKYLASSNEKEISARRVIIENRNIDKNIMKKKTAAETSNEKPNIKNNKEYGVPDNEMKRTNLLEKCDVYEFIE